MTTPEAEARYLVDHQRKWNGRPLAVFNPHGKPVEDLPVIYGFCNGGSPGWYHASLLAESGNFLGGHLCSSPGYIPHDLGLLDGARPDRHELFREHYPDGYRMEYVEGNPREHEGLMAAYSRHQPDPDTEAQS